MTQKNTPRPTRLNSARAAFGFSKGTVPIMRASSSWAAHADRDAGERSGLTSDEKARLKALERANRELRQGETFPPLVRGQR